MRITLATPYTDGDGTDYAPNETVEVDDDTAGQLIRDGRARAAGLVEEAADEDETGSYMPDASNTGRAGAFKKADRSSAQTNPESPATGANSEGVS